MPSRPQRTSPRRPLPEYQLGEAVLPRDSNRLEIVRRLAGAAFHPASHSALLPRQTLEPKELLDHLYNEESIKIATDRTTSNPETDIDILAYGETTSGLLYAMFTTTTYGRKQRQDNIITGIAEHPEGHLLMSKNQLGSPILALAMQAIHRTVTDELASSNRSPRTS